MLWNPLLTWASTFLTFGPLTSGDWDSWKCFTWPWSSSGAWEIIAVQDYIFMWLQRKLQNNTLKKVTFWDCRLKPYRCHLQNIGPSPSDDICMRLQRELYSNTDDNHFVTSREKLTQHVHINKLLHTWPPLWASFFWKRISWALWHKFHIKFAICNEEWITKLMKPVLYNRDAALVDQWTKTANLDCNFYLSWNDKGWCCTRRIRYWIHEIFVGNKTTEHLQVS